MATIRDITEQKRIEERIKRSEARLTEAQGIAHIGSWEWDIASKNVRWSDELYRIFSMKPQEIGITYEGFLERVHPDDRDFVRQIMERALVDYKPFSFDHHIIQPGGTVRILHSQGRVIVDETGQPMRMVGTGQDITERKWEEEVLRKAHDELEVRVQERTAELIEISETLKAEITERTQIEESLQRSEERYRTLYEYNPSMYFTLDIEGNILSVNQFGTEQLGYTAEELVGESVLRVFYEDDKKAVLDQLALCLQNPGQVFRWEFRKTRKDGSVLWVKDAARTVQDVNGYAVVFITCHDITERKKAEESLRETAERLQSLSQRLAEVQEEERRRLVEVLHDNIGQNLTALSINLNIMHSFISPESAAKIEHRLKDSLQMVEETTVRIRDIMTALYPPVLNDYGLLATLRWFGEETATRTGLKVIVEGEELTTRLPLEMETALFRITQEAVNNVIKHACANCVRIKFENDSPIVRLTIADDGVGFDPASISTISMRQSWGLLIMHGRADAMGGRLHVNSAPGRGTKVIIEVGR